MTKIILIVALVLNLQATAQTKKLVAKTIEVNGNCGMCKKTIEKAAINAGAKTANWSDATHKLNLTFNDSKTNITKIKQKIASVGYDTEGINANDTAYNNLHGCCKYERKPIDLPKENN